MIFLSVVATLVTLIDVFFFHKSLPEILAAKN